MGNTTISSIASDIVIKGTPLVRSATLAANTYSPGDWTYYSATGTATVLDSDTAACKLLRPQLLNFVPRLNLSTKARLDVDNDYQDQTTARADLIWASRSGEPLLVGAKVEDPGGALLKGNLFMAAATRAGDLLKLNSGTDPTSAIVQNVILWDDLANTDTVGKFLLY